MPPWSLVLSFLLHVAVTQSTDYCTGIRNCSECVSRAGCVWCTSFAQCLSLQDDSCPLLQGDSDQQYNSKVIEITELPLSEQNQVTLQSISLQLKVNDPLNVTFSVKAANDFPLDFYILMDLSYSFRDDLESVKGIASQIPQTLKNLSSLYQLGFGAFVDKPILPFVSNYHRYHWCDSVKCMKPFGYQHIIGFTNSSHLFNSSIQEIFTSINADDPEGTLDAMLQAVVCKDIIGWRENSRKILLILTDDTLHTAGDGSLAGITKPNDGLCHTEYNLLLDSTVYEAASSQDYPSIEQVRVSLSNEGVVPVFAIPAYRWWHEQFLSYYNDTISPILGAYTLQLTGDSDNLLNVIKDAYFKVISNPRLSFMLPKYLSATVTTNCSAYQSDSMTCSNIDNETIEFTISFTLQYCPQNLKENKNDIININILGFGGFSINVTGQCSCTCDKEAIFKSPHCSNNGAFRCGLCDCDEGWSGPLCNCSTAECPLGPNGITCSGRGVCQCGQCVCNQPSGTIKGVANPHIEGDACECSNYECDIDSDGIVCSGRGTCTCTNGTFTCQCGVSSLTGEQYSGDACQCSTDHCIKDTSPISCFGQGTCDPCQPRGKACTCNAGYAGQYCEVDLFHSSYLISCSNNNTFKDCIKCYIEDRCFEENEHRCHSSYDIFTQDQIEEYDISCSFISGECLYSYYIATLNGSTVFAVLPKQCPTLVKVPLWAIALITFVSTLVIGCAILVIIKFCIILIDKCLEHSAIPVDKSNAAVAGSRSTNIESPDDGHQLQQMQTVMDEKDKLEKQLELDLQTTGKTRDQNNESHMYNADVLF